MRAFSVDIDARFRTGRGRVNAVIIEEFGNVVIRAAYEAIAVPVPGMLLEDVSFWMITSRIKNLAIEVRTIIVMRAIITPSLMTMFARNRDTPHPSLPPKLSARASKASTSSSAITSEHAFFILVLGFIFCSITLTPL